MTSLRGPGERNFNAVSHKPTRAPIQFNSICSRHDVSFGLWDTALKFLSPGPRSDVTDHLEQLSRLRAALFSQSSLSSAGLERAKWLREGNWLLFFFFFAFAHFARFPRSLLVTLMKMQPQYSQIQPWQFDVI